MAERSKYRKFSDGYRRYAVQQLKDASCESFMKTLKREEIYAHKYRDIADLRAHIEEIIDRYYNRQRLHSALGIGRSQREFFQAWVNLSME
jgi:transposase InsO family protein